LLVNAEENLRTQLPGIFRDVSIRLYETYLEARDEREPHTETTGFQNDLQVNTVNSYSSPIQSQQNLYDATVVGTSQPLEPWEPLPPNFDDNMFSSFDRMFPLPVEGVDALLTEDWSFCGLPSGDAVPHADQLPSAGEQMMEES
jgi:hypothetical protein